MPLIEDRIPILPMVHAVLDDQKNNSALQVYAEDDDAVRCALGLATKRRRWPARPQYKPFGSYVGFQKDDGLN